MSSYQVEEREAKAGKSRGRDQDAIRFIVKPRDVGRDGSDQETVTVPGIIALHDDPADQVLGSITRGVFTRNALGETRKQDRIDIALAKIGVTQPGRASNDSLDRSA